MELSIFVHRTNIFYITTFTKVYSLHLSNLCCRRDFEEIAEKENASSEDGDSSSAGSSDPDQAFEKEVVDTFLRCVHEKFSKVGGPSKTLNKEL